MTQTQTTAHTQQLQEKEYYLPYHWLFKKGAKIVQQQKIALLAAMIGRMPVKTGKALDLGCGDGKHTYDLKNALQNRFEFTGVDYSERAIIYAGLLAPSIDFQIQHAGRTQFADSSFDLIVSIEVIEHIPPDEVNDFVAEIYRLLKPGGGVVLTTPTVNRPLDKKHFQHFTAPMLKKILSENNFEVKEVQGFGRALSSFADQCFRYLIDLPLLWRLRPKVQAKKLSAEKATCILVSAVKP